MINTRRNKLAKQISRVHETSFDEVALNVFYYQAQNNPLYRRYLELLGISVEKVKKIPQIPFLPIQFFKSYEIKTGDWPSEAVFASSGTTGTTSSKHHVRDLEAYGANAVKGFNDFYGDVQDYCVLALLPSYLERGDSSLVYMVDHFIKHSKSEKSNFFLNNHKELVNTLAYCRIRKIPVVLVGVSFALLDLAERFPMDLSQVIVMETGGMKGRREEMTRENLHSRLQAAFNLSVVHSEYGMTELLSQAYSKGNGLFYPISTMRVLIREITDPLTLRSDGRSGAVNIIDLANLDTCSFIATDDLGRRYTDGAFEILGRLDQSDIRGCNLMFNV